MLDKIDHIGIASNDVEAVIEKMQTVFWPHAFIF
jgi:hypothetical protein